MDKEYQPKNYFSKGRNLEWGKDLTPKQMNSLRKGEVFILLDKNKSPYSRILMDSYNQIREGRISEAMLVCEEPKKKEG